MTLPFDQLNTEFERIRIVGSRASGINSLEALYADAVADNNAKQIAAIVMDFVLDNDKQHGKTVWSDATAAIEYATQAFKQAIPADIEHTVHSLVTDMMMYNGNL